MTVTQSTSPSPKTLPEPSARVAVASQSRGLVDTHFGHANRFHIYDVGRSHAEFIEVRDVAPYCHGPEDSPGDLSAVLETLQDCQAVMVSRIGGEPEDRLREAGIEPVQVYDTIETALFSFYDRHRQGKSDIKNT